MAVYGSVFLISVFCAGLAVTLQSRWRLFFEGNSPLQNVGGKTIQKKILVVALVFCSFLVPALVMALRYGIGTDYYYTYVPYFDGVQQEGILPGIGLEPGIWLVMKLVQLFGGGHTAFFATTSFLIMGVFWLGIFQNSRLPWYGVALFFLTEAYFVSMNAVQQYMALAIVFWGMRYVQKPCFWKYLLCVLVGTLFHYSTLVLLPLYLFLKFGFNPVWGIAAAGGLTLANPLLQRLINWVVSKTIYGYYLDPEIQQVAPRFYPGKMTVNILVLAIAAYYFLAKENRQNPLYRFLFYCQLLCVFLLINRNLLPFVDRIVWDLEIFQLLLLPLVAMSEDNKWLRAVVLAVPAFVWGQLCYYEIFVYGWHEVVPYQNIFSGAGQIGALPAMNAETIKFL